MMTLNEHVEKMIIRSTKLMSSFPLCGSKVWDSRQARWSHHGSAIADPNAISQSSVLAVTKIFDRPVSEFVELLQL